MPLVRLATRKDIAALADLLGQLFAQEREFSPDRAKQIRGLKQLFDRGNSVRIIVAESDKEVIAMGVMHTSVSTFLGAKVAMLEDVIVTATYRGRGIGQLVMAAIIETARVDGIARLTLLTDHDNVAAQGFYETFGFTRSTMVPYRLMLSRAVTPHV